MKHLKKFNESKSEMPLEDYFIEFVDEGFTIERRLNEFKNNSYLLIPNTNYFHISANVGL